MDRREGAPSGLEEGSCSRAGSRARGCVQGGRRAMSAGLEAGHNVVPPPNVPCLQPRRLFAPSSLPVAAKCALLPPARCSCHPPAPPSMRHPSCPQPPNAPLSLPARFSCHSSAADITLALLFDAAFTVLFNGLKKCFREYWA